MHIKLKKKYNNHTMLLIPATWFKNPKKMIKEKIELMRNFSFKNKCLDNIVLRCMVLSLLKRGKCYPEHWGLNIDKKLVFYSYLSDVCDFLNSNGISFELGRDTTKAKGDSHNGRFVRLTGSLYTEILARKEYLNYRVSQMIDFANEI